MALKGDHDYKRRLERDSRTHVYESLPDHGSSLQDSPPILSTVLPLQQFIYH